MKIGITYDLRSEYLSMGYSAEEIAEFDKPETIDAIEDALLNLNFETERIGNIQSLVQKLSEGRRWDMVFNIAEGFSGIGREAQVPAVLDAYHIPYTFSDPLVLALTSHKGMAKRVVRDAGILTPEFAVVECRGDIGNMDLAFPLFVKPIAEGTSKGINERSKVLNVEELELICLSLLSRFRQPVLVETFLPGREFTAGIVGTGKNARVLGVMEIILKEQAEREIYSFFNKENYRNLIVYRRADEDAAALCRDVAFRSWNTLGCRDGGRVDLKMDARGVPNFLEVNPLAGLHPVHSDLPILLNLHETSYQALIAMIMESALRRAHPKTP